MEDQKLKTYFKFDDADLQANRMGQFSAKQKARLASENKSGAIWSLIIWLGLMLVAAIGPVVAALVWIVNPDWGYRIGFGLGMGILWPLFWIWSLNGDKLFRRAFFRHEYQLAKVQGHAKIVIVDRTVERRPITHHELQLGGQSSATGATGQAAEYCVPGDATSCAGPWHA